MKAKAAKVSKAAKAKPTVTAPKKEDLAKLVDKGRVRYKGKPAAVVGIKPNPREKSITDVRIKVGDDTKWVSGR
jgi:hypothetical protein